MNPLFPQPSSSLPCSLPKREHPSEQARTATRFNRLRLLPLLLAFLLLPACDDPDPRMLKQSRVRPYDPTTFFSNGTSARNLVPGTVPLDALPTPFTNERQEFNTITQLPVPLTANLLNRGRERYNIYCAVCHGATGYGDGMIVLRGFTPPPSFHIDRLRNIPIGHFVDVITNGWGAMYSYARRVPLEDRWAVAAYIRALQLSQHAPASILPPPNQLPATEKQP